MKLIWGQKTTMLKIENLRISYGEIEVLHGVSLNVEQGEIVAIVGSNSSGKTTLLRCISGLVPSVAGRMAFFDTDISRRRPDELVKMGVIQVPEGRHIFPTLSVYDNLKMGAYLQNARKSKTKIQQTLEFVFKLFPILEKRRKQKGGTLSGGEQQMLAIGRALMTDPKLLMLDEPSMGLAPLIVRDIIKTIKQLNREGLTVLLVEQDVESSLTIATRGYVMQLGRIVLEGSGRELLADEEVKAIYLGKKSKSGEQNL